MKKHIIRNHDAPPIYTLWGSCFWAHSSRPMSQRLTIDAALSAKKGEEGIAEKNAPHPPYQEKNLSQHEGTAWPQPGPSPSILETLTKDNPGPRTHACHDKSQIEGKCHDFDHFLKTWIGHGGIWHLPITVRSLCGRFSAWPCPHRGHGFLVRT